MVEKAVVVNAGESPYIDQKKNLLAHFPRCWENEMEKERKKETIKRIDFPGISAPFETSVRKRLDIQLFRSSLMKSPRDLARVRRILSGSINLRL